ncbi:hypothetical protein [Sporosarcina sp. G11-34]|uniref:hypothetical protein n=1 Tax=Sporosarcina sp. G11-34 TaxID=2849605 RepID=UPI0022A9617A|nr:hypothetical protein [Sporosarcina sp. G11-34]MCZ2260923.1 hypothetical protein [Sporosarcina sp. G11-34]
MTYNAKTQRVVLFGLFLLLILLLTLNDDTWMLYVLVPAAIVILLTIFVNFKLKILDSFLTFQICLFSLPLYNRTVSSEQISNMKFKRVGWARKCVVIKNKKAFNFRITNFSPDSLYKDLIDFANKYDVPIFKTKDYTILEK